MVTPQQIQDWIAAHLPCNYLKVVGDGQHFEAVIVSAEFAGKLQVARHQRVYQALGDRMKAEIHALSMRTLTPEEWQASDAKGQNLNG
jgi:acid stress-induced BolA-like protein IbaG/YrbA